MDWPSRGRPSFECASSFSLERSDYGSRWLEQAAHSSFFRLPGIEKRESSRSLRRSETSSRILQKPHVHRKITRVIRTTNSNFKEFCGRRFPRKQTSFRGRQTIELLQTSWTKRSNTQSPEPKISTLRSCWFANIWDDQELLLTSWVRFARSWRAQRWFPHATPKQHCCCDSHATHLLDLNSLSNEKKKTLRSSRWLN